MTVAADADGRVLISSRETAYKVRNLRRRPSASVCSFTDAFYGPWVQIDGDVEIVSLPEAMSDPAYAEDTRYVGPHGLTFQEQVAAARHISFDKDIPALAKLDGLCK